MYFVHLKDNNKAYESFTRASELAEQGLYGQVVKVGQYAIETDFARVALGLLLKKETVPGTLRMTLDNRLKDTVKNFCAQYCKPGDKSPLPDAYDSILFLSPLIEVLNSNSCPKSGVSFVIVDVQKYALSQRMLTEPCAKDLLNRLEDIYFGKN